MSFSSVYGVPPQPSLFVKSGATFQLLITVSNDDGTPMDLTQVSVSSQLRNAAGTLIATLAVNTNAIPGQLAIIEATDTWPVGRLYFDFKFATDAGGPVLKSQTIVLLVTPAITR
jgi:hypothetical protein